MVMIKMGTHKIEEFFWTIGHQMAPISRTPEITPNAMFQGNLQIKSSFLESA